MSHAKQKHLPVQPPSWAQQCSVNQSEGRRAKDLSLVYDMSYDIRASDDATQN
jgi:hypothetical protein